MAAQLMAVKLRSPRGLIRWMARASTSLPVPLSPVMSTVVLWRATRLARSSRSRMLRLSLTTRSWTTPAPRLERSVLDLAAQLLALVRLADGHGDFVGAERLLEVVVGALAHGGDGGVLAAVGAHHDEQRVALVGAVPPEEGEAVHLGHAHVAEDEVELLRRPRA